MTRAVRVMAGSFVVALLAAGCGVPTSTGVRVDGPPEADAPGVAGARALPPGPEDAESPEQLVEFFLRAAAADPENPAEVLREFIHPDERDGWQPAEDIYVARIDNDPLRNFDDPVRFDLTARRIGQLNPDGTVEPLSYETEEVSLYVRSSRAANQGDVRAAGERYWIVDPPEDILLDDQALDSHFQARPIYFWDQQEEKLVPDLRWLPESMNSAARSQKVLQWLLGGPASWLESAVRKLPGDIALEGNVVPDDGTIEVRLTAPSQELDRRALAAQLWWTLRPDLGGGIEVTIVINDEQIPLDRDYGAVNPIPDEVTASFAIVGGTILPYLLPVDAEPPPVLADREDFNQGIERAALSREGRLAAVVRQLADGRYRLDLAGPDGVVRTKLTAREMSRPVWLNNPGGIGLIAADGVLYSFTSGRSAVVKVEVPSLAGITAVAVAPDGRRLALVAGGDLYLASMARTDGRIQQIVRSRWVPTTAANLDGVAFTRENRLAVIGAGEQERELYELTVDGALEQRLRGLGSSAVSDVVAFPVHPVREGTADISIMYEADGRTYRYTRGDPVPVDAGDLLEDPADGATPLAPFYLD